MPGIVIVGAGHAAVQLVTSLRQDGYDGDLTIIGDEPHLPYQRPPLSKTYMKHGEAERLLLKAESFFETNRITLLAGTRVVAIDREARQAITAPGTHIDYDHLVLATGAQNVRPPLTGAHHPAILELRTLAHAEAIRARLARTGKAIVIGGGFIGLEFAAMAAGEGVSSTIVEAGPRLMARAVSPLISDSFLDYHRSLGNEVLLDAPASEIVGTREDLIESVRLADGRVLSGDLVLLAAGVRPNTDLAEQAGIACRNGILVDGRLATDDPRISAIGDCASVLTIDGIHQRLESVQAATDQARHLSRRLAKGDEAGGYHAVPWFWSDQGELKLQIAGLASDADGFEDRRGAGTARTIVGFRGDHLVSVETINAAGDHMAARRLLALPQPLTRQRLSDSAYDLRALAKSQG
ncbi:FAD-dependent oxidoreductase [Fulvimarina sp. 2208YS6-2-32]|uniref:FAD-dependent oxidoreductase n=1 Tax=Fulvimarina uroteuthidis TaxID=3098149 RepID=A0ABU5I548_9HYPH|nr:FAD-dependent oxidoreductase [Fulvimarina sp. 2208YS6-2-32]MDY8110336.1 FAD-dependent oxidoreductase [Fulvimarina sp. 2208YS6-2-32]